MPSDKIETNEQAVDNTTDGEQSTATVAVHNTLASDSDGTPHTPI